LGSGSLAGLLGFGLSVAGLSSAVDAGSEPAGTDDAGAVDGGAVVGEAAGEVASGVGCVPVGALPVAGLFAGGPVAALFVALPVAGLAADPAGAGSGWMEGGVAGAFVLVEEGGVVVLGSVASGFCAATDGLLVPRPSHPNFSFFQRKYPNPRASAKANRMRTNFPAPPRRGSSSSSSR
jgi:hypothetical protein